MYDSNSHPTKECYEIMRKHLNWNSPKRITKVNDHDY